MPAELIMGANGFLGQHLARLRHGRDCLLHSLRPASAACRETGLPFVQENLTESRRALQEIDPETVYLLARPVTQDAGVLLDFTQNLQWLLQEWADRGKLKRVVFASTQLVYATPKNETPLPVASPLGPETPYDCHKAEMEFYLALLAHHKCAPRVEIYRLPLLAGCPPTPEQVREQYLYLWRAQYRAGWRWLFPFDNERHKHWGNSWAHTQDVANLMIVPREGPRYQVVQPVSGHLSYVAMDAFFRERYGLPAQGRGMDPPKTMFYLADNAGCPPREIEDAFPEEAAP